MKDGQKDCEKNCKGKRKRIRILGERKKKGKKEERNEGMNRVKN